MNNIINAVKYWGLVLIFLSEISFSEDLNAQMANPSQSMLLKNYDHKQQRWNGVGKIFKDGVPLCTASLLDTRDENNQAIGPAYLLTAAHCVSRFQQNPVTDIAFEASVTFNFFNDTPEKYKTFEIQRISWASRFTTDIAILELATPLSTLIEEGVTPLKLEDTTQTMISDIVIVGAPNQSTESGLRLTSCQQQVTEGALVTTHWTHLGTFKNTCTDISKGSSGSPVLDRKTEKIVGVLFLSTFIHDLDQLCFNTACEVVNGNPSFSIDTNYSHRAEFLAGCFEKGVFRISSNRCSLEPSFELSEDTDKPAPLRYSILMPADTRGAPTWELYFTMDTPYYRFKSTRDARDCRDPNYYSHAIDIANAYINATTGREPGIYFLCMLGVESAEQRPSEGLMRNLHIYTAQLAKAGPVRTAEPTITMNKEGHYEISWHFAEPLYSETFYYTGPTESTICENIELKDYFFVYSNSTVTIDHSELPLTLCSLNKNYVYQTSAARTDLLIKP